MLRENGLEIQIPRDLSTMITTSRTGLAANRPDLHRHDSATSQTRGKHMTTSQVIEQLSSFPAQLVPSVAELKPAQDDSTPPSTACPISDASTSTVTTTVNSEIMSPTASSKASTSTNVSEHSVVRGFKLGHISTPVRSSTKKQPNEVSTCTSHNVSQSSEAAIETDSEDDVDESAIEDEDSDEDEWEDDDNEESGPPSVAEHRPLFSRVDSKPNLTSRRSLLTTALHQGDRASALQNEASRSSPAIRRSRTTTPNGPSTGNSPHEDKGLMMREPASRPKPIIMTTSNVHPPAMSPKTCRRNMLTSELTGSLRQNQLWERQQKNATTNAVAKRAQSAVNLRRAMTTGDVKGLNTNEQQAQIRSTTFRDDNKPDSSYNQFFDGGDAQEYHRSGW